MPNLFGNMLLLNLRTGQPSWNTHGSGLIKQVDHKFVHLKNKNRKAHMRYTLNEHATFFGVLVDGLLSQNTSTMLRRVCIANLL